MNTEDLKKLRIACLICAGFLTMLATYLSFVIEERSYAKAKV